MNAPTNINWEVFFPPGTRVSLMPNPYERSIPRLAIEGRSPFTRWRSSSFYPAYRWTGQMWRLGLRLLATTNRFAPETVFQEDWPLGHFLEEVLPAARNVTVLFGMPGPGQQITVQVRNRRQRVIGYVKYAEPELAQQLLTNEYTVLSALPEEVGPQVLKFGAFHQGLALVSVPLQGSRVHPAHPPGPALLALLRKLTRPLAPAPVEQHPYFDRLPRTPQVARLMDQLSGRAWPVAFQHGDLLPWNLRRAGDGSLRAFDWEHGALSGFPMLDLAYYLFFVATMVRNLPEREAEQHAAVALLHQRICPMSEREALALVRLSRLDAASHAQKFNPDPEPLPDGYREAS